MITALSCIGSSTKSKDTHNNNELRSQTMLTAQTKLLKRNNNNNNPFLILSPPPSLRPFPSLPFPSLLLTTATAAAAAASGDNHKRNGASKQTT
jgi:hypothetical protein